MAERSGLIEPGVPIPGSPCFDPAGGSDVIVELMLAVPVGRALAPAPPHRDALSDRSPLARLLPPSHGPHAHVLHAAGFARADGPVLATLEPEGLASPELHDALGFAAVLDAPLVVVVAGTGLEAALSGLGRAYGVISRAAKGRDCIQEVLSGLERAEQARSPRLIALDARPWSNVVDA